MSDFLPIYGPLVRTRNKASETQDRHWNLRVSSVLKPPNRPMDREESSCKFFVTMPKGSLTRDRPSKDKDVEHECFSEIQSELFVGEAQAILRAAGSEN